MWCNPPSRSRICSGSYTNLSADDTDVYAQVGITHSSYNNAQLWQVQNVRPGGPAFEVTLTNSNVNVARLRSDEPAATGGQTGQVVKKTIPAGTVPYECHHGRHDVWPRVRTAEQRVHDGDGHCAGSSDDDEHWRASRDRDHSGHFRDGDCDHRFGIDGQRQRDARGVSARWGRCHDHQQRSVRGARIAERDYDRYRVHRGSRAQQSTGIQFADSRAGERQRDGRRHAVGARLHQHDDERHGDEITYLVAPPLLMNFFFLILC